MKLTRFERARIIGARSLQLSMGAPVLIKSKEFIDPIRIAIEELKRDVIPLTVRRSMPLKRDLGETP